MIPVSFKVTMELKNLLIQQAQKSGLSLGEMLREIVKEHFTLKTNPDTSEVTRETQSELTRLRSVIGKLQNPTLEKYFNQLKDSKHEFTTQNGEKITVAITEPFDVYQLLLHSFKIV